MQGSSMTDSFRVAWPKVQDKRLGRQPARCRFRRRSDEAARVPIPSGDLLYSKAKGVLTSMPAFATGHRGAWHGDGDEGEVAPPRRTCQSRLQDQRGCALSIYTANRSLRAAPRPRREAG